MNNKIFFSISILMLPCLSFASPLNDCKKYLETQTIVSSSIAMDPENKLQIYSLFDSHFREENLHSYNSTDEYNSLRSNALWSWYWDTNLNKCFELLQTYIRERQNAEIKKKEEKSYLIQENDSPAYQGSLTLENVNFLLEADLPSKDLGKILLALAAEDSRETEYFLKILPTGVITKEDASVLFFSLRNYVPYHQARHVWDLRDRLMDHFSEAIHQLTLKSK